MVYYSDTTKFYEDHREEINDLLTKLMDSTGIDLMSELLRDWDNADPLAMEIHNQNLLAWFGYEEVARSISEEI